MMILEDVVALLGFPARCDGTFRGTRARLKVNGYCLGPYSLPATRWRPTRGYLTYQLGFGSKPMIMYDRDVLGDDRLAQQRQLNVLSLDPNEPCTELCECPYGEPTSTYGLNIAQVATRIRLSVQQYLVSSEESLHPWSLRCGKFAGLVAELSGPFSVEDALMCKCIGPASGFFAHVLLRCPRLCAICWVCHLLAQGAD